MDASVGRILSLHDNLATIILIHASYAGKVLILAIRPLYAICLRHTADIKARAVAVGVGVQLADSVRELVEVVSFSAVGTDRDCEVWDELSINNRVVTGVRDGQACRFAGGRKFVKVSFYSQFPRRLSDKGAFLRGQALHVERRTAIVALNLVKARVELLIPVDDAVDESAALG